MFYVVQLLFKDETWDVWRTETAKQKQKKYDNKYINRTLNTTKIIPNISVPVSI